jgi:predicted Zn finger-like uncharacterized protein
MSILIHCPDCDAKIRAPDSIMGRQVKCPKCDAEFTATAKPAPGPYPVSQPAFPEKPEAPRPELPPGDDEEWPEETSVLDSSEPTEVNETSPVVEFLLFRTMIGPLIIQVLFWLGVVLCVLAGLVVLVMAILGLVDGRLGVGTALLQVFGSLGIMLFGPLLVRIQCEMLILFFRIHDTLKEIQAATAKRSRQG